MSKNKRTFERKEKKYKLTLEQYNALRGALVGHMQEDEYGLHTISSIYFDTDDYKMIQHSMTKPDYKEKFRVRSYGTPKPEDKVFVEIKKKVRGTVYKRRIKMKQATAFEQLATDTIEIENEVDRQIANEISWVVTSYNISPKVMIAYDRIALFDPKDSGFRITFDFNIRWRSENLDLAVGSQGALVAPEIYCLMEVKALGAFPMWFSTILAKLAIYPNSFSKFAQCYVRYLLPATLTHRLNVVPSEKLNLTYGGVYYAF